MSLAIDLPQSESEAFQEICRRIDIISGPWCTVKQAQNYTGFSRNTILDDYRKGELQGYKHHGEWRFHKSALDNWIMGRKARKLERTPINGAMQTLEERE